MKTFLTFYFLCCCTLNVFAQEIGFPMIRNYSPKEYKNAPQVWSVLQDDKGLMYFGVGEGLMMYDGVKWKNIKSKTKGNARDLVVLNNKIFVAVTGDFGYLESNPQGKTAYKSLTKLLLDTTLKIGIVWSVKATDKEVYFQSNETIFQYLPTENKINLFKADTNGTFNQGFIYENAYYTRLSKKGLMKIENGKMIPALQSEFFKDKNAFSAPIPYNQNTFLLSHKEGFWLYHPKKDSLPTPFEISNKDFLIDNSIYSAYTLNENNFMLGSTKKGALLIDKQGKILQAYNEKNTLQNKWVFSINEDIIKNIWLGTSGGISKTEHSQDLSYWDKNAGLNNIVESVIRYQGKIYIATHEKVYFIDKNNQPQEIKNIPVDQNWDFVEFKIQNTNKLLLGAGGIYEIEGDKAKQIYKGGKSHVFIQSKFNPNRIYSEDTPNLISFIYENNQWKFEGKWEGIKDAVRGIIEDKNGELWLGTFRNGVIRVVPDYENITKPKSIKTYTEKDGFPSLKNILPFRFKDKIIFGTEKGLYIHNPKTDKFEPFCELGKQFCDGSRDVFDLKEMPDGKIWICPFENSKADIGYLQPNNKGGYDWIYQPFRRIPEMFLVAFYIEPNGVAWIGGSEGVYRYDGSKDTKNYNQKFNCLIREVRIGKDSIIYYGGGSPSPALPKGEEVITYQYNTLKFEFAAPFFDQEEKTLYRYQLEGHDSDWSAWGRQTEKEYTSLWEGTYTFKVQARNVYDVESTIATYTVTILPPFYRTWWAYLIYVLLGTLAIYGLIKWNIQRLEKEKVELENIVRERTTEIMQQNEEILAQAENLKIANGEIMQQKEEIEVQSENLKEINEELNSAYTRLKELENFKESMTGMIVHDLKNPLNTILGFAEQDKGNSLMKNITQAGKQLLSMVMNILDIQKFENAAMQLVITPQTLTEVVQTALHNTHLLVEEKRLQLVVSIPPTVVVDTEFDILLRILENLLTNAIKYTPMRGLIEVGCEVLETASMVKVFVRDTGQGIPADKIQSVFDKFSQVEAKKLGKTSSTGLGLTFCKMAVEAHGGQIGVESTVGVGTTFWFTLTGHVTTNDQPTQVMPTVPNHSQPTPIQWTAEELAVLQDLKKALQSFEIYESGAIFSVLNQHKAQTQKPNILAWIEELQAVVFNFEEQLFKEMINN